MKQTTFIPTNAARQKEMLDVLQCRSFDDLFSDVPQELQTNDFDLPPSMSECAMMRKMRDLANKNRTSLVNFCGAGFYDHYIPSAVDAITGRGEFYTAYTPYQPEVSQGTLQAIFEYQTAMARLTGMDVSNASMYDGGTALFEGVMMALRATKRSRVLVDKGVNPIYRTMLKSYTRNIRIGYEEIDLADGLTDRAEIRSRLDKSVGAVVVQNPNFFGCVDDYSDLADSVHSFGALVIASVYPMSLGLIKPPGEMGVDIVTGEGQCLGNPLSFGGPYLGFLCTTKKLVRSMPGRVVGETTDAQGRTGYVLTLQAREQHIRRQKATSNICSNEALCALRALVYLSLTGKNGFADLANSCASRATYAWNALTAIPGVELAFPHSFFNEFTLKLPCHASDIISRLLQSNIAAGFPVNRYYDGMDNMLLLAFTEQRTKGEIDQLVDVIRRTL